MKQKSKKQKRLLLKIIMFMMILTLGNINYSSVAFADNTIDMTNSFNVIARPVGDSSIYSVESNKISLGNINGATYNNEGHYQWLQATSKFSINWNRSFVMDGEIYLPDGPDSVILAFHNNPNKELRDQQVDIWILVL